MCPTARPRLSQWRSNARRMRPWSSRGSPGPPAKCVMRASKRLWRTRVCSQTGTRCLLMASASSMAVLKLFLTHECRREPRTTTQRGSQAYVHNARKICRYDMMTSDSKAAESFYRSVIGWDTKDSGMADRSYTLFSAGPMMVGGMMPISEEARAGGARPAWNGYVLVDDVDVYAERVKAAGGAIHRAPEDIPGVGRFSVAADPHGGCSTSLKQQVTRNARR